jgi:hypothetical protein
MSFKDLKCRLGKHGANNCQLLMITWGIRMQRVNHLRDLARRCRALEKTAIDLEVIEQLKIWATELAEIAEGMEGPSVEHETAESMVSA